VNIDKIRVGKRHRKDPGDIAGLAVSIEDIGNWFRSPSCAAFFSGGGDDD
jgi:hypothetical protein